MYVVNHREISHFLSKIKKYICIYMVHVYVIYLLPFLLSNTKFLHIKQFVQFKSNNLNSINFSFYCVKIVIKFFNLNVIE